MNNFITIEEDSIKKCKNFGYTFSFIFFLIFLYNFFFMSKNLAYYFLLGYFILFVDVDKITV